MSEGKLGIILEITPEGKIEHTPIGNLREADLMTLAYYLQNLPARLDRGKIIEQQAVLLQSVKQLGQAILAIAEEKKKEPEEGEERDEECGKESSLEG